MPSRKEQAGASRGEMASHQRSAPRNIECALAFTVPDIIATRDNFIHVDRKESAKRRTLINSSNEKDVTFIARLYDATISHARSSSRIGTFYCSEPRFRSRLPHICDIISRAFGITSCGLFERV